MPTRQWSSMAKMTRWSLWLVTPRIVHNSVSNLASCLEFAGNICLLCRKTSPMWSRTTHKPPPICNCEFLSVPMLHLSHDNGGGLHSLLPHFFGLLPVPLSPFQILEPRSKNLFFHFSCNLICINPFLAKKKIFLFFHINYLEKNLRISESNLLIFFKHKRIILKELSLWEVSTFENMST